MARRLRPWLLAVVLLGCAACGGGPDPAPVAAPATSAIPAVPVASADPAVKVELDVFSGRPNPTWTLSAAERDALRERLDALPQAEPREIEGNLGYRGFLVHMPSTETGDVTVQRGIVFVSGDAHGVGAYYRDPDRALERWLLDTGGANVEADVSEMIERELRA